jgi:hypothetical protein
VYHIFRIQLALDLVSASGTARDIVPLVRAIPNVTNVPHGMHVQWFVNQEEPNVALLPDFPESVLIWEVRFNGRSPFADPSYACTLKTTVCDFRAPLVHMADAEAIRVDQRGEFEYDVRLADEGGRTISLEHAVLIVS